MTTTFHRAKLAFSPESERVAGLRASASPEMGDVLDVLFPMLNGTRSTDALWGQLLIVGFEPAAIARALSALEQGGLVEEAPDSPAALLSQAERDRYAPQMALFASAVRRSDAEPLTGWEYEGGPQQVALKLATVVVAGSGLAAAGLVNALSAAGVGNLILVDEDDAQRSTALAEGARQHNPGVNVVVVQRPDDLPAALRDTFADLLVYCPDVFDESACEALNELCLMASIPLLPYRERDAEVELGPLVIPGDTACYVCYRLRREAAGTFLGRSSAKAAPRARLNFALGVDWLALEVVKVLTEITEPVLYGRLLRLSFASAIPALHPVLKLPRCPSCGVHKHVPARKLWDE